jgi:hypothetical protein
MFLDSSEMYRLYLLGSSLSLLIGCLLVEQFNCEFWMPCAGGGVHQIYINCFTDSGTLLAFLGSF